MDEVDADVGTGYPGDADYRERYCDSNPSAIGELTYEKWSDMDSGDNPHPDSGDVTGGVVGTEASGCDPVGPTEPGPEPDSHRHPNLFYHPLTDRYADGIVNAYCDAVNRYNDAQRYADVGSHSTNDWWFINGRWEKFVDGSDSTVPADEWDGRDERGDDPQGRDSMNVWQKLMHSRKFWLMVVDLVFSTVLYFGGKYAGPSAYEDIKFLVLALQPVLLLVIGTYAYEDVAAIRMLK